MEKSSLTDSQPAFLLKGEIRCLPRREVGTSQYVTVMCLIEVTRKVLSGLE